MARPKRGDVQQQKRPYLLGNCDVLPYRVIPPKCTIAKEFSRMTHQQHRRGAAYHEAGHAVVASVLGLSVGRMEIAIDDDDAKGAADIEMRQVFLS
jgi:hypothetical protein